MVTAEQQTFRIGEVCKECGQVIRQERVGNGFGAETRTKCGCPDPFAKGINTKGWGS